MRLILRILFGPDNDPIPWVFVIVVGVAMIVALAVMEFIRTLPAIILAIAAGNSIFVIASAIAFSIVVSALTGAGVIRHRLTRRRDDILILPPKRSRLLGVTRKLLNK